MKNKFNFKSIILTLTLLTLGVGQMWATDYYFRHWDANNSTQLVDQGSNIYSSYFILNGSISFKISDASWTNANTFGKNSSAISLNSEYSCASPGSDFSLNFATNRAYLVRLNASGSTKKLLISTFVPSAAAPSAVVSGTNAMFYIQGYEGLNYLANSSKTKASNSYPMNYTGISYVNTAKSNLSTYDYITNNPGSWVGDEATNIKSATGGELITRGNAKTAAKTASTTASVTNNVLSISTTTNSTTGVYGSLPLYIQYYIDGTFVGVTYSASTASYGDIPAGGATARASTYNVSELTTGSHALKTVLTDGIIFWVADTDNFEVTPASTATLTYHANWYTTGTSGDVPDAQTVAVDATATVAGKNTLAMTNYTFSGWNTEEYITGTDYAVGSSITMDEDKDLYAKWTRSITLNQNGATTNGTTSVTGTYNCSTLPSITNPKKSGYTFVGWRTENNGTGNLVINTSGQLQSNVYHWTDQTTPSNRFQRYPTSTSPLYATWTQNITLNANTSNHGSGTNKTAAVTYNSTALTSITHCTPATGYKVEGYYTAATDGTKILNADGTFAASSITNYITSSKWTKAGATTLYAHYEPKTTVRLYYSNPAGWSTVKAYVWSNSNTSDQNATWSGVVITTNTVIRNGDTYYYYEYYKEDHPNWDRVIFNDGGSNQTNDITFSNTTNNGQYNDAGKSETGSWHDMPVEETMYSVTFYAGDHGAINAKGTAIAKNGNASVNIGATARALTATPESGYSFDKWVTTGSVTVTDPYSASTTVSASAAGGTVRAHYLANSGWYLQGGFDDYNTWETTAKALPVDRPYRGISGVYYRPFSTLDNDDYFGLHDGTNKYSGHTDTEHDYNYSSLDQVATLYVNSSKSFQAKTSFSNKWAVIKTTGTKTFWIQNPETCHTVTVSNDGAKGTVVLKTDNHGNLTTTQFTNGETIRVEIDTMAHYSIASVTLGATNVTMTHSSGTKYTGTAVMPNSDVTLTVTYTPWYKVQLEVGTVKGNANTPKIYLGSTSSEENVISSGSYVISGSTVIFWVANGAASAAKAGYNWWGFRDAPAGTNESRWTNNSVSVYTIPSISADAHIYAVFGENDYTVTVNTDSHGKVDDLSSTTVAGHIETKVTLPTATADPGYYFVNWTTTAGTLTNSTSTTTGKINGLTSTATVTANFAPIWTIAGLGGDWNTNKLPLANTYVDATVNYAYLNIDTLQPNTTYEFKAIQRSQGDPAWWRAENTTDNKDIYYSNSNTRINMSSSDGDNFYLHTAGAGRYTFDVNLDNSKHPIKVHYPTSYTVTFGSAHGTVTATVEDATTITTGQYAAEGKDITFAQTPATGYTFKGWYNAESGGTTISCMASDNVYDDIAGNISVYAQYDPKEYTVTLTNSGTGYGSGGQANLTATYDAAFPSITLPTATNGYAFMGYWSAANGEGTQFTNASGVLLANITDYSDESGHWKYDASDLTLYAYYKKAEITTITLNATMFEPVGAGDEGYVVANPTIAPTPTGTTSICWKLLYDNDNPVPGHDVIDDHDGDHPNRVKFSIAGLAAGAYKIRATLHTGDGACGTGTTLSTLDASFTIASAYVVTIQYKCGSDLIQASTTSPGKPLQWTEITAPDDIFGYTFSKWKAGEGITIKDADANGEKASATINYKASFNGILTAIYTKKSIFYFKNTLGWEEVYVNFMSNQYWDGYKGSGNKNNYYSRNNAMSLVPGTTDIYYIEYTGSTSQYITFTSKSQDNAENFWGKDPNVQVVVPTRPNDNGSPQTDFGYYAGTNMFIPLNVKVQTKNTGDGGGADYYNRGYWVVYDPITGKTGYTLEVYNKTDDSSRDTVKVMPFTFNAEGVLEATVDLEAATNYGIKFRRDNGMRYTKNGGTLTNDAEQKFEYHPNNWAACAIKTTAAGDYVFTINCSSSDGFLYLKAHFPAAVGDFQVYYKDNSKPAHPSRMITARASGVDTISFFVDKTKSPMLKARKVNSIDGGEGTITWGALNISGESSQSLSVDSTAVYNFVITQSTAGTIASIENIGAYKGDYYIRCAALNSKWDFYRSDRDHLMTYSSFSESDANAFGEKFSHYKTKWCKYGKNVKFCIANDYSPCISDTLVQDVPNTYNNIDEYGFLEDDDVHTEETENIYSANIRFMWNRKTNKVSRAYVASSTNKERLFLVLRGNNTIEGEDEQAINEQGITNGVVLQDKENWMYEEVLYILPGTRFKLFACYAEATPTQEHAQYFRGNWETGDAFISDGNSVVLIGGSGTKQKARIIYDFKTNRLMAAWIPSGADVSGDRQINADVLVEREHQEPAQYITFANTSSQLSGVKTVYGAMKFNRWILNNRQNSSDDDPNHGKTAEQIATHHAPLPVGQQKSIYERSLYFISFPFDVNANEIFGFGHYWDEWYLEYYDGLNRAKNGYWEDSPPNWKYVTPSMLNDFVLKANEGYILGLDLDFMKADNFDFWSNGISTVELFFPSTAAAGTLKQTNVTIPALSAIEGDPYRCTINRGTTEGDRRVKDSYWRCLGVPSFNIYNTSLTDGSGNPITWQPSGNTLPFIYAWNKADNTLTAQSTSTFTFLPMHAYLVQNGGEIRWENVSAKPASPIVARRVNEQPATEYEWRLALMSDSILIDQTYIKMSNLEQVTDTFDFNQDLIKEFNTYRSDIYTYIGNERVAANSMPLQTEQTTVIPVGVKIKTAGEYTFAMPDGTNGVGVTLIDTETGVRTSLGLMDYTVTLTAGSFNQRFFLEISPVSNVATDIELINDENGENGVTGVRKVLIDNKLFIIKDGEVYDARGAMVK